LDAIPLEVVDTNAAARRELLDEMEDDEQEEDEDDGDDDIPDDGAKGIFLVVVTYLKKFIC